MKVIISTSYLSIASIFFSPTLSDDEKAEFEKTLSDKIVEAAYYLIWGHETFLKDRFNFDHFIIHFLRLEAHTHFDYLKNYKIIVILTPNKINKEFNVKHYKVKNNFQLVIFIGALQLGNKEM